jgi:hypothetical protein
MGEFYFIFGFSKFDLSKFIHIQTKRRKDECLFFKVDFERAYDTVSWSFLERMMIKMGFSGCWMKWMRACIFNSSMSVLVNGSSSEDFKVGRGLRQGDPLSPFLFLIAAESLAGMMRRALEIGNFKGFQISDNIQFQMLQFADDTILTGEGTWDNLWTIKTLLRSFELVSGLKINFVKSKLYGVNVASTFLTAGSAFLSCRSESIPFKFLGIPVGANPRRRATWKPIVENMEKRLTNWRSRHLSYGGRITLINSVLSSLPLYFFSFFKAPRCILLSLVRIQRNFLWGGGVEAKKLCWVKWDHICLPKAKGGLGVKNLEMFNLALLSKWKWRLLTDADSLWSDLLSYRYGHFPTLLLGGGSNHHSTQHSIWWKDIINNGIGLSEDWFRSNVSCCVGDGRNIGFWKFKWYGNLSFKELYPNLFAKELIRDVRLADRLRSDGAHAAWEWQWNGPLSETEQQQLDSLCTLLVGFSLHSNRLDSWRWIPGTVGIFSVKSCYNFLLVKYQPAVLDSEMLEVLKSLWKNDLPSKVLVFGWRLLLQRLPTRRALHHRGILHNQQALSCVFCSHHLEDCEHLFFDCSFIKGVWNLVFQWIGRSSSTGAGVMGIHHFSSFGILFRNPKCGRSKHLIWLTTTWCVWKLRNQVVFNGVVPSLSSLMEDIKTFSWLWFNGRIASNSCISFFDWCQDPMSILISS